ncbi:N(1)-aminopropylagmatine ureohydrolase [archaeon MnTg01]|nr:N(1)-aminopropylagmatine ureohydrolase [archaeon MnTg01]
MEKTICWANTDDFEQSEIVVLGIPDESQSHALRKGASEAPHFIREISNLRDSFTRKGKKSLGLPFSGIKQKKILDYGNISKDQINEVFSKIVSKAKIPIMMGGDHSITKDVIKAIAREKGPLSLVYFDAHPDFVSSTQNYYGSVFYDVLPDIDPNTSLQIGIRTPEQEELDNLKKYEIKVITPFDIVEKGVKEISNNISQIIGKNVYISFDMDCIDPAFAPGVSVPVPMGLKSVEAVFLLKTIVEQGIVGMDIMEVCPSYDIKDRTSHLASRIISEVISSST